MKQTSAVLVCCFLLMVGFAWGEQISVATLPPSVVNTVPECGDIAVDAAETKQISVKFSKDMMQGSWSWVLLSGETFPKILGEPKYLPDRRTCVVNVELQPGRTYIIWLNSDKIGSFKDVNGNSAVPYLLVFKTKNK